MVKKKLSRGRLRKMKRHLVSALIVSMLGQNVLVASAATAGVTDLIANVEQSAEEDLVDDTVPAKEETKAVKKAADETESDTVSKKKSTTKETKETVAEKETEAVKTDDEAESEAKEEETAAAKLKKLLAVATASNAEEKVTDGDLIDDLEEDLIFDKATSSNATAIEENIFESMPEIGSDEFTKWFFDHADNADLWEWFLKIVDADESELEDNEDAQALLTWFSANEEQVLEAYQKMFGGIMTLSSAVGTLWDDWTGDTSWSTRNSGTEADPYRINSLAELMGLSEMVAAGNSFEGNYFQLESNIDLTFKINNGSWNPIGWYQNKTDLSGSVTNKFSGNFDGNGYTISGLKVVSSSNTLNNVGLFGAVDGGSIKNLTIEAESISAGNNVGVLAGSVEGDTVIYNVTVKKASVLANGNAGGLVGDVTGDSNAYEGTVTFENCTAEGVSIQSSSKQGYVGGIAGSLQNANVIDCRVRTYTGNSNRIQGQGYVGGIVGRLNMGSLYNTYVSGTIGGTGSSAIGGIIGKYVSGNMVLARFDGTIAKSNAGVSSHEGTFVGTRESRDNFSYGTGADDNFAYLFTKSADLAKNVIGSNIDSDNSYTLDAHIGYWTNNEKLFHLIAGSVDKPIEDTYFYEELEDAVKYIVTKKVGNAFASGTYADNCDFSIDHFAPNGQGAPIRGYLVSIPRIDTVGNGVPDTDVATLTAIGKTTNSYYKTIDKDHPSAVAYGDSITVSTAAKNKNGNRYQMVYDESEPGKVKPPTYIDEEGDWIPMNYLTDGTYTFEMPECDTELNVEYIKVTTSLTMTPAETTLKVVQTRSGDRKNPDIVTEVFDGQGKQIAKYIGNSEAVTPSPVAINAKHNGDGNTTDKTVMWSVDKPELLTLTNVDTSTYTDKDAYVMPNLNSSFIKGTIDRLVQAQVDSGYAEAIDNTVYQDVAVVTAHTAQSSSQNNIPVVGNSRVNVTLQIVDQTTRRVEGLNLNYSDVVYTVTRKLTGDRTNPTVTLTASQPKVLYATLTPTQPFYKNVTWKDTENGQIITLTPTGTNSENCSIGIRLDANGVANPAWIQNVINADNDKHAKDPYAKLDGSATHTEKVTATSEDQTHGVVSASCNVTINFVTVDETVVHPTSVTMSQKQVDYNLSITKKGDNNSDNAAYNGFDVKALSCTVNPDITDSDDHKPYDRSVTWSVSDPDVLTVDKTGKIVPNKNAEWIQAAQKVAPYSATKTVKVYATANDNTNGTIVGETTVTLKYETKCLNLDKNTQTFNIVLTKSGHRYSPTLSWNGGNALKLTATSYPNSASVAFTSSNTDVLTVSTDGTITPVLDASKSWMQAAMASPYTAVATVNVTATDGTCTDVCVVKVNLKVVDSTYLRSSGGSGGGGGGSSHSVKVTGSSAGGPSSPAGVTGTWTYHKETNKWSFASSTKQYKGEWAYIANPYAIEGQPKASWFHFDKDGNMETGWFTDTDGHVYYLNPSSDGTQGRMVTGWVVIDHKYYYFTPSTITGHPAGSMYKGTTTPDNYTVNANGEWTVNGYVQLIK